MADNLRWVSFSVSAAPGEWVYSLGLPGEYATAPNPLPLDSPLTPVGGETVNFFVTGASLYPIALDFYVPEGPAPSATVTYGSGADFQTDRYAADQYHGTTAVSSAVSSLGNGLYQVIFDIVNIGAFFGVLHTVTVSSGSQTLVIYIRSEEVGF